VLAAAWAAGSGGGCLLPRAVLDERRTDSDAGVVTDIRRVTADDAGSVDGPSLDALTNRPDSGACVAVEGPASCGLVPVSAPMLPEEPLPVTPDEPAPTPIRPTGEPCQDASDCQSAVCAAAGCGANVELCCQAPSCNDDVRNGTEPVTDCGNAACGLCAVDAVCTANAQCQTGSCRQGACALTVCANDLFDGTESDVDCGGADPLCPRCQVGANCRIAPDCASSNCINGECADCDDDLQNGRETGVDCGGLCGACPAGGGCASDSDCQSGVCQTGRCCGGVEVDCTRCARRLVTSISCSSNGPAGAPDCEAFLQCLADNPDVCPVRNAAGCSEAGGVCDHERFGGNGGSGIATADAIVGTANCLF
jgi:hypothetical protein